MSYTFETTVDGDLPRISMLLDGAWQPGEGPAQEVFDKYRTRPFAQLHASSEGQIERMIGVAHAAFEKDQLTPHDRGQVLDQVAILLEAQREDFIAVMQIETGYTTADCLTEINRTIETLRLSAEEARRLSGEMIPVAGAAGEGNRLAFTLRVPLGVVLAVTPFNAPLNTVTHKIAPALGAGNTVVLKPASQTPRSACLLAELFLKAGLPSGHLQVFHGSGAAVNAALADERVRYVAFTGSTGVGRLIQQKIGLRRAQMELGSIAFTVLAADADLDDALPKILKTGYRKAGQVCTSVQILLVHESRAAEVERRLAPMVAGLQYGDPAQPGCDTGPLISLADAERVEAWINEALAGGARLLAGGGREGSVIAPTLLADVTSAMKVGCDEIFGPVICIETFADFGHAVDRVNATPYGLATGIFTRDLAQAFAAMRRLRVGGVHINQTSSSRVDMMPYGGSKDSGFGREGPRYAMQEMTEERLVSFTI